jgi:hypothetical protein
MIQKRRFSILALSLLSATLLACSEPVPEESPPEQAPQPDRVEQPNRILGRWLPVRDADAELTPEQRERIAQLQALGYVAGSIKAPAFVNVVRYTGEAYHGLNFFISGHAPEARLIDMRGTVLHRWRYRFSDAWPGGPTDNQNILFWRRAHLFENGDILAIHEGLGILKLDRDSRLLWAHEMPVHHDMHVMPDGRIFVLARAAHMVPSVSDETPVLEDYVVILDSDGTEIDRFSLLEVFDNSAEEHSWNRASRNFWDKQQTRQLTADREDLFHTNSLYVLDGSESSHPAFREGNLLISMCHLDMVAVVDPARRQVTWSSAGMFSLQHDPTVVEGGKIMVFDNNYAPERSRIVTVDPDTRDIAWRYGEAPEEAFFSRTCGTAQRLPNGNTLITESDNGRAFEITPDRKIVWEFYNPHRSGFEGEYIATLFELVRLDLAFPVDWASSRP